MEGIVKTLLTLLLLAGSAFATHRGSVHLQEDKGMLVAYVMIYQAKSAHRITFNWTHKPSGKKVSYTTKRKASGSRTWLRHGVKATVGMWSVVITNKDARGKELAWGSYTVAALPSTVPISSTLL